jgi:hypothetical protein
MVSFLCGLPQDRKSLASSCGAYRTFATDADNSPIPPEAPPEAPRGSIGTNFSSNYNFVKLHAISLFEL